MRFVCVVQFIKHMFLSFFLKSVHVVFINHASCAQQTLLIAVSLHDKLFLMWGDYKDKVDELTLQR